MENNNKHDAFDRFADHTADLVAHAGFFLFCVALVVLWFPTLFILNIDTSQLIINTATTIITFLLVALLHNTQHRFEQATNARLERIIEVVCGEDPVDDPGQKSEVPPK